MGEEILRGLQACPKVFPEWYQYDKEGSRLFQKNKLESQFYYFNPSETSNLTTRVNDIVSCIEQPCDVVDLGSGYMKNTRLLIDCLLKKQDSLNLYPIDKSTETLQKESKRIAAEYGDRLTVLPIPGDYSVGLDAIRNNVKTRKIIVMLGGSIQNIPYDEQTSFLKNVVNAMTDKDIFVMTVDINTDGDAILKAYLGGDLKSGGTEMYRNLFTRFNKEFGTTIDPSTFDIDGTFKRNFGSDRPSQLEINAISKIDQMHTIPNTSMTLRFSRGERVKLGKSDSNSYKYTVDQIKTLCDKAAIKIHELFIAPDGHTAMLVIKR